MSKILVPYQPNLVYKIFANYLVLLEMDCPKGLSATNMNKLDMVPVRGVDIDILEKTLNRYLFGPNYQIPGAIT